MNTSHTWGTREHERALAYPCDRLVERPDSSLWRGVTIEAPAAVVWAWLCQLRVAPYSYDWIDNWGRPSPRRRDPRLLRLEVGQPVMTIFRLVSFETDRHLTIRMAPRSRAERLFGAVAVSYLVAPEDAGRCRLLAKVVARFRGGPWGAAVRRLLPWGDLVMMRRQLLNLRRLAEKEAADPPIADADSGARLLR